MVAGDALMASIMACRPPSMRLAISISPSRVSSSTVPISRMYMRTGSVVRPEFAVHGGEGGLGFFLGFLDGGGGGGDVVLEQRLGIGRLLVHGHAHVVEHGDHDFHGLGIDQLVGQVVGDLDLGQVATGLAQRDQGLQARAALGQVFLGQDGVVQAEFLHQGAFLRLADLHAQGLDLLGGGRRLGRLGLDLALEFGFDVRQVGVVARGIVLGGLGLAAALGGGLAGGGGGCLGRAAGALLGRLVVIGRRRGPRPSRGSPSWRWFLRRLRACRRTCSRARMELSLRQERPGSRFSRWRRPSRRYRGRTWATSRTFERAWTTSDSKTDTQRKRKRVGSRRGWLGEGGASAVRGAGPRGQDVWAIIWCAVLAVWGRWCVRVTVARPGGAAVALADEPYIIARPPFSSSRVRCPAGPAAAAAARGTSRARTDRSPPAG